MADEEERDLGFGAVVAQESRRRLLNRDGSFNVAREGLSPLRSLSAYHALLTMSWAKFLSLFVAMYLIVNALFAEAYYLVGPGALHGPAVVASGDGSFVQAFFFSVETFGTIGYGHVYPASLGANIIMTVEALVGLLTFALATGVIFARFSRPTPRIRFSRAALIAPYRGARAFEFRIVNERQSQIVELEAKVVLTRFEAEGGRAVRRFHELALERRRVTFFPLGWTIVHPIDETSPLYGVSREALIASEAEFLVLLSGLDESFSQVVHTRSSYRANEVVWRGRFRSLFNPPTPDGVLRIDIARLDDVDDADGAGSAEPVSRSAGSPTSAPG